MTLITTEAWSKSTLSPDESSLRIEIAIRDFANGQWKNAFYEFERAYQLYPEKKWLLLNMGRSQHMLHNYKTALKYYEQYEHEETSEKINASLWGYKAQAYERTNNNKEAIRMYNKLIKEDPQNPLRPLPSNLTELQNNVNKEEIISRTPLIKKPSFWGTTISCAAALTIILGVSIGLRPQDPPYEGGVIPLGQQ